MRAKINKEILKQINYLFEQAKKTKDNSRAMNYIKKARQIAKRSNTKLPKTVRRIFCHKCNTLFSAETSEKRIKNKKISIKCLVCGKYTRYKIK